MTLVSSLSATCYRHIAKPYFFRQDPEDVHDTMTRLGETLGKFGATRFLARAAFAYDDPRLQQRVDGIDFPNPIGLAAGFDKDAHLVDILPSVGFGFEEIGSVTGEPCAGNPRPRLWRLPKSKSLVVYYGLKNEGCEAVSARLRGRRFAIPIGTSVAKTNCAATVDTDAAIADYEKAYRAFADIGSYTTVNISCPNAFGGQPFTDPASLERLLARLEKVPTRKPTYLKLSPDVVGDQLDAVIDVAMRHGVRGFISSNLTKDPAAATLVGGEKFPEKGGLSGKAVAALADAQLAHVRRRTGGSATLIGCGGVFSAEDAYRKIRAGASLVQMITGMIFEGPQVVGDINRGLAALLKRDGFANVGEAVGIDAGKAA
jgi:dihydroorotate dehydrogenase